ncbi:trypsin-like cysteine/serine peptidase domain-containing protein [Aspergillus californicus]
MKLLSITSLLTLVPLVLSEAHIVGGHDAEIENYPYQVSIQYNNIHVCGGSLISDRWVITASHCLLNNIVKEYSRLSVRVGSTRTDSGGSLLRLSDWATHPDYATSHASNDIAVVQLISPVQFEPGVAKIDLATTADGMLGEGNQCNLTGWGYTKEMGQQLSPVLQTVTIPVINQEKCVQAYRDTKPVTGSMFCAGYLEGGTDSCQGDSGGPLVSDGKLVGIVSWGSGCARKGFPGVYASVPALRQFVRDRTGV